MLKFKGCPRCPGDLFFDYDFNGHYEQCLQCGYMRYLPKEARQERQPRRDRRMLAPGA